MKRLSLPKFVILCLSMSLFAACSNQESDKPVKMAAGAGSATGQKLSHQTWCSEVTGGENGRLTYSQFTFDPLGSATITNMELEADGHAKSLVEESRSWGLYSEQLVLTTANETRIFNLAFSKRVSDEASCLELSANGVTRKLCSCSN